MCGKRILVTGQLIFPTVQSASSQNVCTVCLFLWPSGDDSQSISLQQGRYSGLGGFVAFSPVKFMTMGRKASHPILCHTFWCYSWPPSIITWGKPSHSLFQDPFGHTRPILHGITLTMTFINRLVYYWTIPTKTYHNMPTRTERSCPYNPAFHRLNPMCANDIVNLPCFRLFDC